MELKDFVGVRKLSGIDLVRIPAIPEDYRDEADGILFVLDGVTYKAEEDPSDGYRSYCNGIEVTDQVVKNLFEPQEVLGRMKDSDEYGDNDVIEFCDIKSGEVVLAIGTNNYDDYYPYCVLDWHPENLWINKPA